MSKYINHSIALLLAVALGGSCSNDDDDKNALTVSGIMDGHEYVDLGLPNGICWATYNVGANSITEYGDFFAWGETTPKDDYSWDSYKFVYSSRNPSDSVLKKYTLTSVNILYPFDCKGTLDPEDDAATANWGGRWKMPSQPDMVKLYSNCTWEWTYSYKNSGTSGYIGTSKINGNQIFLPAAGHTNGKRVDLYAQEASFFTSTLSGNDKNALFALFNKDSSGDFSKNTSKRHLGRQIRPVFQRE